MSDAARHLLEEALRLPVEERSRLIEKLIQSVDADEAALSPVAHTSREPGYWMQRLRK